MMAMSRGKCRVHWRIAALSGASALSGAFGGLIAHGIELVGERRGIVAWRWLFIIDGAISLVVCGGAWFSLPKNAETTWFLTEEEKGMMLRKLRDVLYKGTDEFLWEYAKMAFKDPLLYIAGCFLFWPSSPFFGVGTFSPDISKGPGLVSLLWLDIENLD